MRKTIKTIVFGSPLLLRMFRLYIQPILNTQTRTERMFTSMNVTSDVFLDVGANVGLYTIMMRGKAQKILAFEPIPANVEQLKMLGIPQVDVHPYCLGSEKGKTILRIPSRDGELITGLATIQKTNNLSGGVADGLVELLVEVKAFDEVWKTAKSGNIQLIKIDVEGFEYHVLQGMSQTLRSEKPLLLIEIEKRHNPDCFEKTFRFLEELGYSAFYTKDGIKLTKIDLTRLLELQAEDEESRNYYNNFFFLLDGHIGTYNGFLSVGLS